MIDLTKEVVLRPVGPALGSPRKWKARALPIIVFAAIAFTIAYLQPLGESPDFRAYDEFLSNLRTYGQAIADLYRFESGFVLLSSGGVYLLETNLAVVGVFAAATVLLKGYAIQRHTVGTVELASVGLTYFVRYYPLHELTQIRASIAIALVLCAGAFVEKRQYLLAMAVCGAAPFFHFSAALVGPMVFLRCSKRTTTIVLAIGAYVLMLILGAALLDAFGGRLQVVDMYHTMGYGDAPNLLSSGLLLDWAMIVAGLVFWRQSTPAMRQVLLQQLLGMAIFYAATDFAVIAHRLREFISVFWVIYMAEGLRHPDYAVRWTCIVFVSANIALYSYLHVFSGRLFPNM